MTAPAEQALPLEPLADFLRREAGLDATDLEIRQLAGGSSNLTYMVETGGRQFVLRHPPLGHGLASAHDMGREYRVLAALGKTAVPVPQVLAYCEDESLIGADFYLMEFIDGVILADKPPVAEIPAGFATTPAERHAIGAGLIDALVALHAVDYTAVGLADFGRPDGYTARQVRRWANQWHEWQTRESPAMEELLRRLQAAVPDSPEHTIVHGDFRLGNCILDRESPGTVRAVLDWEMSTLGDPIADLGYCMVYWGEPGDPPARFSAMDLSKVTANPGFMARRDLIERYAQQTGRDVSTVDFYEMLARVKLAVFGERGYARILQAERDGVAIVEAPSRRQGRQRCDEHVEVALALGDASENPALRGERS
ncbi:MAG: phosphotransferase family protein [Dehalococcoidia bacterium]|nr:phosphotransferase family protein [Dehalococcoidia bacterium]